MALHLMKQVKNELAVCRARTGLVDGTVTYMFLSGFQRRLLKHVC